MACNIILASWSFWLHGRRSLVIPRVNIGFVSAIVMAILWRSVSEKAAFVVTGETVSTARAHELALVHRVFADEHFSAEVENYVAKLAARSASIIMLSKGLLYNMDSMSFEAALQAGIEINANCSTYR